MYKHLLFGQMGHALKQQQHAVSERSCDSVICNLYRFCYSPIDESKRGKHPHTQEWIIAVVSLSPTSLYLGHLTISYIHFSKVNFFCPLIGCRVSHAIWLLSNWYTLTRKFVWKFRILLCRLGFKLWSEMEPIYFIYEFKAENLPPCAERFT